MAEYGILAGIENIEKTLEDTAMLTPNFNFDGRCEQAIALYKQAFGAHVDFILHYSDANPEDFSRALTDAQKRYVYHAEVNIAGQRVMMCDNIDIPFQPSLSLSLVVTMDTKQQVMSAYDALKDGATIIYPPHSTTYSSCEVVLVDRFGFRWGVMTEQTER